MLPDIVVAVFLTVCISIFTAVNLGSMRKSRVGTEAVDPVEAEAPNALFLTSAALGTGLFFLESILYAVLVFGGLGTLLADSPLQLRFVGDSWLQVAGMAVTASGYVLFLWSVLARGRYATSWEMPQDQKLVTWGPYRYVRHPSYLAYFILFAGLFLLVLNLIALLPLVAVPGYVAITAAEEEMLTKRFGAAYREYERVTGRFVPKRQKD